MISLSSFLIFTHLIGLSLAVGAATVKNVLLIRCKSDLSFVPTFLKISRPVTKVIILGLVLLTLSGIGWILYGYSFSSELIVKLIFVAALWIIGPVIDNKIEPKFIKLAPAAGQQATPEFLQTLKTYIVVDVSATLLFYIIIILWVLV